MLGALRRILILASGDGTNFEALARAILDGKIPQSQTVGVICNREGAGVLERARQLRIPSRVLPSKDFFADREKGREKYSAELLRLAAWYRPDWICLAGYMLLLDTEFIRRWPHRITNIHPSLLPAYPGLRAIEQALEAKDSRTGCTVHLVTPAMDSGPIVLQRELAIAAGDTPETLHARLRPIEHAAYIEAMGKLCTEEFDVVDNRLRWKRA